MAFDLKIIIGCNPSMTIFITWASHCVVGVGKDSGMGVGKDSGMVHEGVSSHFMAWRVGFQVRICIFLCFWNANVKCKHCMCT